MYIINNRDIPEFEKTAVNNIGLDINTVNSIINVIKNNKLNNLYKEKQA